MRLIDTVSGLGVAALVSVGQVLLRRAAKQAHAEVGAGIGAWLTLSMVIAVLTYGTAMLLWLWLLTRVPLGQAFAFFGLCFFLVPLFAFLMVGDPISPRTWVGGAIIIAGIYVASGS